MKKRVRINKYWRHKDFLCLLIRRYKARLGCFGERELLAFMNSRDWFERPWSIKIKRKGKR